MSKLIINAVIVRCTPSERLRTIKFVNSSRCIFCYKNERLSVLIYNIDDGEVNIGEKKRCEIAFLTGDTISESISVGERFELTLADEVVATGCITGVLKR